jgi:hypothetical protein
MAEERVIKIVGDTSDADKKIKGTTDGLKDLDKQAEKTSDNTANGVEKIGKASKKSTKSVSFLTGGFKKLGLAIKATGIGLVVSLVASLGVAFSKNQRFIDAFNTVTETLGIILSQVANAFVNVYDSVSQNTENFDALGKVLNGLLTVTLTPLKLAWYGIKLGIQEAQLAWEGSVFGGKDKDKMDALTESIKETKQALYDTGKDAILAGSDIVSNFSEAITETGEIAKKTQNELSKVSIKNAKLQAENIVKLQKASELAEAKLAGLTLKYQNEAELQRQIRDDVRLSIEERIQANDRLGEILEEQTKEELKLANTRLSLASAQLATDKNKIENQVAYQNALNEVIDVEERINGQKSEQIVNEAALLDERKANLQELQNIGKTEQELAEQELLTKLENQKTLIERTVSDESYKNELLLNAENEYQTKLAEIKAEEKAKKEKIEQEIKENEIKANKEKEQSARALENAKINLAQNGLSILGQLAQKGSALAKGVAVSQAVISTYQGINKALAETTDFTPTQSLRFANAAAVGIAGLLNVKSILSTNESSTGGANASTPTQQPSAPSFNLVQGTGSNQVAQTVAQQNQQPVKAYVVGSDVTTQQQLDRNKINVGSI